MVLFSKIIHSIMVTKLVAPGYNFLTRDFRVSALTKVRYISRVSSHYLETSSVLGLAIRFTIEIHSNNKSYALSIILEIYFGGRILLTISSYSFFSVWLCSFYLWVSSLKFLLRFSVRSFAVHVCTKLCNGILNPHNFSCTLIRYSFSSGSFGRSRPKILFRFPLCILSTAFQWPYFRTIDCNAFCNSIVYTFLFSLVYS